MSAETLRDAAKVLRDRAEAATPPPWTTDTLDHVVDMAANRRGLGAPYAGCFYGDATPKPPNATYIATMHPGVGLALADLLETLAYDREVNYEIDGRTWDHNIVPLARLILGERDE